MKEKLERKKKPKEQIIVDLSIRKNKTAKNDQIDKKLSSSSFENAFNEESAAAKSKW